MPFMSGGDDVQLRTRESAGGRREVFCPLRRRWVALTPEECVRQLFTLRLTRELGYPATLMAHEVELRIGAKRVRCDTIVYDSHLRPLIIVEYKSADVPLSQSAVDQVMTYNTVLRAPLLILTNGRELLCWHPDYARGTCSFLDSLPHYDEISDITAL